MTRRPRWTVPTAPGLLLAVSLGTVALAQDDGDGSAAPAEDVSGTSVPRGPFVDFCPTPTPTMAMITMMPRGSTKISNPPLGFRNVSPQLYRRGHGDPFAPRLLPSGSVQPSASAGLVAALKELPDGRGSHDAQQGG